MYVDKICKFHEKYFWIMLKLICIWAYDLSCWLTAGPAQIVIWACLPGQKTLLTAESYPVLAFLVIYHEIRDFELDPRDKNFCSVTSHEPLKVRDFGKFPKKLGKSSNFAQKVIISVTKNQK